MNLIVLLVLVVSVGIAFTAGLSIGVNAQRSALLAQSPAELCYTDPDSLHSTGGAQ